MAACSGPLRADNWKWRQCEGARLHRGSADWRSRLGGRSHCLIHPVRPPLVKCKGGQLPTSKVDLATSLLCAAASGSLVTPKHDPAKGSVVFSKDRSVINGPVSSSLCTMLQTGSFSAEEYLDPRYPNPHYVLEPSASFSSLGSFIPSGSTGSTGSYDRLIAVNGAKQGWHLYAENQAVIDQRVASGSITHIGPVR